MKRVDQIILYLSGELDPESSGELEKEMEEDASLRETFLACSAAYDFAGDQLRMRDEQAFRDRVREIMNNAEPGLRGGYAKQRVRRWGWLSVAASAAVLAVVVTFSINDRNAFESFYRPEADPFILALKDQHRGLQDSLLIRFVHEEYEALYLESESILRREPENRMARLLFLMASIELDREDSALQMEWATLANGSDILDQAVNWYLAMACLKSDAEKEATLLLQELADLPGPYARDAEKLLRLLTK